MKLDPAQRNKLALGANQAVQAAIGSSSAQSEPDIVARVTLHAVPSISKAWSKMLAPLGYEIVVAGAFIHKSPMVTFSGAVKPKSRCELADLLVVVDELSVTKIRNRRAILLQAKRSKKGRVRISKGQEQVQHDLYCNWPPFEFEVIKAYGPGLRDISNSHSLGPVGESGRYASIATGPPIWTHVLPGNLASGVGVDIGTFLVNMLNGQNVDSGRTFIARGNDDWSRTINDLIRVTSESTFVLRSSFGDRRIGRPTTRLLYFSGPAGSYSGDGNWQVSGVRETSKEDAEGISVLRISVRSLE